MACAIVKTLSSLSIRNVFRFLEGKKELSVALILGTSRLVPNNGNILLSRTIQTSTRTFNNKDQSDSVEEIDAIELLKKLLNCSFKEANELCEQNSEFLHCNKEKINERVLLLQQNQIVCETIKNNFWILTYEKEELKSRLKLLTKWHFINPNNGISILRLPFLQLLKYSKIAEQELKSCEGLNRISFFANFVQKDEKRVCELFMKYSFMMTIKLTCMKEILSMTKEQRVSADDVLCDLWLFRYRPEFIANRIKLLDQIGAREKCKVIKPWMLRCPELVLNRYFELKEENMAALGSCSNMTDLLSNELGLTSEKVDEMIFKHPPLAKMSYSKAKEMIDFLKSEGFNSEMIYNVPRVLCHKQATLKARLLELKKIRPSLINLQNLCKNRKEYVALLNKISGT